MSRWPHHTMTHLFFRTLWFIPLALHTDLLIRHFKCMTLAPPVGCHALLQNKSPHKLATLLISGQHEMVSAYLKKVIILFPTVFFIGSFQVEYKYQGAGCHQAVKHVAKSYENYRNSKRIWLAGWIGSDVTMKMECAAQKCIVWM